MVNTELTETSVQLPSVATDIGGFLIGVSPGLVGVALVFGIIGSLFLIIALLLDKDIISMEQYGLNLFHRK